VISRRRFIGQTGAAFAALAMLGCSDRGLTQAPRAAGYGPLIEDPNGLLDLPEGFRYHVLSQLGELMDDGTPVPDKADGMGCFQGDNGELILVRNHELRPKDDDGVRIAAGFDTRNGRVLPGGTSHIVLDGESLAVKRQFRSLGGTIRKLCWRHHAVEYLADL
jgi:secreted PhoX family phosphatase